MIDSSLGWNLSSPFVIVGLDPTIQIGFIAQWVKPTKNEPK
jgi:hypothetical protein